MTGDQKPASGSEHLLNTDYKQIMHPFLLRFSFFQGHRSHCWCLYLFESIIQVHISNLESTEGHTEKTLPWCWCACYPAEALGGGDEHNQHLVQGSIVNLCSELKYENDPRVVLWQQQNGTHTAVCGLLYFHASLDSIHHFIVSPVGGLPQGTWGHGPFKK